MYSFIHVAIPFFFSVLIVFCGIFDAVRIDGGNQVYAEKPKWNLDFLPDWLQFPGNAIVNVGYIIIGCNWIRKIRRKIYNLNKEEIYMFEIFLFMAVLYGPVQFMRIATRHHTWAVLDQWFTAPFFIWVFVWALTILYGWNKSRVLFCFFSHLSYIILLFYDQGFDIILGIHIAFAFVGGLIVYIRYPNPPALYAFISALFCCCGFVFLKLLDHWLSSITFFQYLSGHFWSKICDFLQIHFVVIFFLHILRKQKLDSIKRKE